MPSPLKSPTETARGLLPTAIGDPGAGANLPLPSPSRVVTLPSPTFATARSAMPSLLKSPVATGVGRLPTATGNPGAGANPPLPSPSNILTLLLLVFVTARSAMPSPLKSPTARPPGPLPTATGDAGAGANPPLPSPNRMLTLSLAEFATARSAMPSPLKSALATPEGIKPTAIGDPAAGANPPLPSPNRMLTLLLPAFVTARSTMPSPLKSPVAIPPGPVPTANGDPGAGANPPLPSPSRILTLSLIEFATARSAMPSPLKSALVTTPGPIPAGTGDPEAFAKLDVSVTDPRGELPSTLLPFVVSRNETVPVSVGVVTPVAVTVVVNV